ncbi:DNA polymerase III subunit beta [Candidatus Curtissbacteria bacterium]|nr:DNA polymerase III subunit beta [Candidatus Curtissbacteria bacterium]
MKFIVPQQDFAKALLLAGKSLMPRANLPILSNLLVNATKNKVEIVSTNLETATKIVIPGRVEVEGKVTLAGKTLGEFVAQLPQEQEITFEKLGEEVQVLTKGYKARLATIAAEEFPAIPVISGGHKIKIGAADFARAATRVAFAAAQDEGRPILTGVLCEFSGGGLAVVATDGYRLSFDEIKVLEAPKETIKIVVPARAIAEVAKTLFEMGEEIKEKAVDIVIAEGLNQMSFKIDDLEFTSRLIEGEFPNWQKVIPTSFVSRARVNKEEFTRIVRIASIFARDSGSILRLKFASGDAGAKKQTVNVSAGSGQVGSGDAQMEVEMVGPGGEIAFNYRYLLEALGVIEEEDVNFEMVESLNPGRLTGAGGSEKFFHIIMPVRLQT